MSYSVLYSDGYLCHHGIMGQKWGLRRWQYSDGSLTPDGRVHYGIGKNRKNSTSSYGIIKKTKRMVDHARMEDAYRKNAGWYNDLIDSADRGWISEQEYEKALTSTAKKYKVKDIEAFNGMIQANKLALENAYAEPKLGGVGSKKYHQWLVDYTNKHPESVTENEKRIIDREFRLIDKSKEYYNRAKNEDKWDMEFLERADTEGLGREELLRKYKKYLNNGGYLDSRDHSNRIESLRI